MQAGAEKLGVIEASYASAVIGVERRLALAKPVARSRQGITATRAADSQSLRKASRPPQTRSLHLEGGGETGQKGGKRDRSGGERGKRDRSDIAKSGDFSACPYCQ